MRSKLDSLPSITSVLALVSFAGMLWAGPSAAAEATYIPAATVQKLKYKPPAGPAATNNPPEIIFSTIAGTGAVNEKGEMHQAKDVFYVVTAGHADVVAGGTLVDEKGKPMSGAAEDLFGKITGAHTYSMSPGDVLWMPAGTAHLVNVPKGGTFTYVVFRGIGIVLPPH